MDQADINKVLLSCKVQRRLKEICIVKQPQEQPQKSHEHDQGGLVTAFDLVAFRLSMIAPVKKSVNHSGTVASVRETVWEKQQKAHLRSDSTVCK